MDTVFLGSGLATTFFGASFFGATFLAAIFFAGFYATFFAETFALLRVVFFTFCADLAFAAGFLDPLAEDFFEDLAINGTFYYRLEKRCAKIQGRPLNKKCIGINSRSQKQQNHRILTVWTMGVFWGTPI